MDLTWVPKLVLAIISLIKEHREEMSNIEGSNREARIVSIPPGAPVTTGIIFGVPVYFLVPFIRQRLANFGKKREKAGIELPEDDVNPVVIDSTTLPPTDVTEDFYTNTIPNTESSADQQTESPREERSFRDVAGNDFLFEIQLNRLDGYLNYMEVSRSTLHNLHRV
jgi:hypothetical protein